MKRNVQTVVYMICTVNSCIGINHYETMYRLINNRNCFLPKKFFHEIEIIKIELDTSFL